MFSVLLADDEKVICEGLKALLDWEELGFEVCSVAKNGLEILELLEEYKPDLLITDIKMPKMDGLGAIVELRSRNIDIEVLILTGFAEFEYALKALEQGACGYLMKPVDDIELSNQLVQIAHRLMTKRKNHHQSIGRYLLALCNQEKISQRDNNAMSVLKENAQYSLILVDYMPHMRDCAKATSLSELELCLEQCLDKSRISDLHEEIISYTEKYMSDIAWPVAYKSGFIIFLCDNNCNADDLWKKLGHNQIRLMVAKKANGLSDIGASFISLEKCRLQYFYNEFGQSKIFYESCAGDATVKYEPIDIESVVSQLVAYRLSGAINTLRQIGEQFRQRRYALPLVEAYINLFITRLALFYDEICKTGHELYRIGEILKASIRRIRLCDLLYILELILSLMYQAALEAGKEADKGVINEVMNFMKVRYQEKITLKTVSEYFYLNPAYFGQLFKRKAGISFNEYLSNLRMEKAKLLLSSTGKSISEISYDVGFDDPNYFSVTFGKKEGMTPREYRLKSKKR